MIFLNTRRYLFLDSVKFATVFLVLATFTAGCAAAGDTEEMGGPRIWIDAPLNSDAFIEDIDTILVYSHASGDEEVAEAELFVDGELVRIDSSVEANEDLVSFEQPWNPPGPGEYLIEVRAKDQGGQTGPTAVIQIRIGGELAQQQAAAPPAQISGCPVPDVDTLLYVNQSEGYCFLYPNDHTEGQIASDASASTVIQGPAPAGNEGLTTSFSVYIEDAQGKATDQYVTETIEDAKIPGSNPAQTSFVLDGETGFWTEELPSQVGARNGFLVHNETGFSLIVIPNGGDFDDINIQAEDLWNTITISWKWLDSVVSPTVEVTEESAEEPEAIALQNASCRVGANAAFTVTNFLFEGESAVLIGRITEGTWFYVELPNELGRCWIFGENLELSGPVDSLPFFTPPELPAADTSGGDDGGGDGEGGDGEGEGGDDGGDSVPSAPSAASNLTVNDVCNAGGLDVSLSWQDNSDNETGFRVYRNGSLQATLPAGTTNYNQGAPHTITAYSYAVEAYNGVGNSSQATAQSNICPVP